MDSNLFTNTAGITATIKEFDKAFIALTNRGIPQVLAAVILDETNDMPRNLRSHKDLEELLWSFAVWARTSQGHAFWASVMDDCNEQY